MNKFLLISFIVLWGAFLITSGTAFAQTTYYSRNGGTTDWDDSNSWTLSSDGIGPAAGPPGRTDNVVILPGHTIDVDNVNDNGSAGVSPDFARTNLGYTNVGSFNASGTSTFFHTGNITINVGGTLTTTVRVMLDGTTYIDGDINVGGDLINLGDMFMTATSSFSSADDLILSDDSNTNIDDPSAVTNDDLYMDWTTARLCGLGSLEVGLNPNIAEIQFFNGAVQSQICSGFTITGCAQVTGCSPPDCIDTCPSFSGTGNFDDPVLSGTTTPINYTENDDMIIMVDITVTDADDSNLPQATISITGNYVSTEDRLNFTDQNGIVGSYDIPSGVLTLTGVSSIANYQSALRSVSYENLSDNPDATTRTVSFTVRDFYSASNTLTRDIVILPVNDAPTVITGTPSDLNYTEGDLAVAVDNAIAVDDPDTDNMTGATISIAVNYINGEDVLAFTDQVPITGSFNSTTGVLTLSGTAPKADYQTALRAVTYENTSQDPSSSTRTVEFVVNDGLVLSSPFSRNIIVIPVNDKPTIAGTVSTLMYTEGDGAAVMDNGIATADVDDTNLETALVAITANYVNGEDMLALVNTANITGSFNATNGELTLTGPASKAEFSTALSSVTYENTSVGPSTSDRTVQFTVNDGDADSDPISLTIQITPVNSAPTIGGTGTVLDYTEGDGAVAIDNGITVGDIDDTDIETGTVSITTSYITTEDVLAFANTANVSGSYNSSTGVMTLTGPASLVDFRDALRTVTYENTSNNPNTNDRIIDFVVNDGDDNSTAFSRTITIQAVAQPPVISTSGGGSFNYNENSGQVVIDGNLSISDPDDSNLESGTVTINAPNYVQGQDFLAFTTLPGITGSFDGPSGVLSLSGAASLADYQTVLRSATYENTSDNPIASVRTVRFTVNDGDGNGNDLDWNINVIPSNDKAVLNGSVTTLMYTEGSGPQTLDGGITASDIDDTNLESATVKIINYVNGQDLLDFIPSGVIAGSFNTSTGELDLSNSAAITDYQNVLQSVTYENTSVSPDVTTRNISFVVNDGDVDSDPFNMTIEITSNNSAPTLSGSLTDLNYVEGSGTVVIDNVIAANDIDDVNLENATVTINNYVNGQDVLAFTPSGGITGSFNAATGALSLSNSATLADYQTTLLSVTYENTSNNPNTTNRIIDFVVNDGEDNSATFSRTITIQTVVEPPMITGTGGGPSGSGTLNYTENDPPTQIASIMSITDTDDAQLEGATIAITANYIQGEDMLDFTLISGVTGSFDSPSGIIPLSGTAALSDYLTIIQSVTYENTSDSPDPTTRTVSFMVDDGDGNGNTLDWTINIIPVNDKPVLAGSSSTLMYTEGTGAQILDAGIAISDIDDINIVSAVITVLNFVAGEDLLDFTASAGITGSFNTSTGQLGLSGTATMAEYQTAIQSVTYENTSQNPNITTRNVTFAVNDGNDNSDPASMTIEITAINLPPVVTDAGGSPIDTVRFSIPEDLLATLCLQASDPDGNTPFVSAINLGTGDGTAANGSTNDLCFDYTPAMDFTGTVYFTVDVCDDGVPLACATVVIEVTVQPVNDPPVAVDDNFSGQEDEIINGNILTNDFDVDGDNIILNTSPVMGPVNGQVMLNTDGTFSYTPFENYFGDDTFTYEICDDASPSECDQALVTITLSEVIDPVIVYDGVTPNGDSYNETWIIDGIKQYPSNQVRIFDRWNRLVYQASGYNNVDTFWRGQSNEGLTTGDLPNGTYYYVISLGNGTDTIEGYVELKR